MDELKQALGNIIDRLPSIINELSPEEFAMVKETMGLASRRLQAGTVDKQDQIPKGAEFLYLLAGGNPQAFANYARQFPDAELNRLGRSKQALDNVLQRLSKQVTITRGVQDGIPQADLQSSTVYGYGYDPRKRNLYVKFQGDGVYKYDNVPYEVFKRFAAAEIPAKTNGRNKYGVWWKNKSPSAGSALNALIKKGGYNYTKVA